MGSLRERLTRKPPGHRFTIGPILAIYAGLTVALFVAALDQTIVPTALPRIVSDLGGITQYSWVFTAYLLASTVTVPLYGKIGDVYGRKRLMLFAIVVFLAGSALCGVAQNMTQLVLFRAVQGLGAGGLIPLAISTARSGWGSPMPYAPAFFAGLCVSALVLPIVLVGVRDVRLRRGFEDVIVEIAAPAAAPPTRAD